MSQRLERGVHTVPCQNASYPANQPGAREGAEAQDARSGRMMQACGYAARAGTPELHSPSRHLAILQPWRESIGPTLGPVCLLYTVLRVPGP